MTTKLTMTITAAALAAFTAFAYTDKPKSNTDEIAALKARLEKLENDFATFKRQALTGEPITNKDEVATFSASSMRLGVRRDKRFTDSVTFTGVVTYAYLNTPVVPTPLHESDKLRIKDFKVRYEEWCKNNPPENRRPRRNSNTNAPAASVK